MPEEKSTSSAEAQSPRERLTPADRSAELLPWRLAQELTRCSLYWLPVSGFPIQEGQRNWLLQFLDRWTELMKGQFGLRAEVFLQYKTIHPDLMTPFMDNMLELIPIMGLGRKPGAQLPAFPPPSEIQRQTKSMFEALKRGEAAPLPDAKQYMPDYSYWFVDKARQRECELFFGHGGMTIAFLKPDPNTVPPSLTFSPGLQKKMPLLQKFDIEKARANAASLADGFQAKSKQLFGAGWEREPQMKGIPFILPMLDSADFFTAPEDWVKNCFQVFSVYFRESPADQGMLLAFEADMEEHLIELLKQMRQQELLYPER